MIQAMRAEGERRAAVFSARQRAAELRRLGDYDLAQEFEPPPVTVETNPLHAELRWKQDVIAGYERQYQHDIAVCKLFRSTLLRVAHDTTMTEQELRDLAREIAG
jgi:hypothetical protein